MDAERIEQLIMASIDKDFDGDINYLVNDRTLKDAAAAILAEMRAETPITEAGLLALGFVRDGVWLRLKFDETTDIFYSVAEKIEICIAPENSEVYEYRKLPNVRTLEDVQTLIRLLGGDA